VVGDGDTVGVGTEIAQGMLRTSEGSFAVDDPVMAKQLPEPGGEDPGPGEELEVAMEAELALGEGALQSGGELYSHRTSEERTRLEDELHRVTAALTAFGKVYLRGGKSGRKKRTISAAGRKRIAAAQRARWAKVRSKKR
jgi:hypothetical protein